MSEKKSGKDGTTIKEMSIALGASLDASNIELQKITKGPVNYAISHIEFSLPVKEATIDGERNVTIVFPKTQEEMAKTQYVKVNIEAVPRVITAKAAPPIGVDVKGMADAIEGKLKDLVAKTKIPEEEAREFIGMAKLIVESSLAGIEGLDETIIELLVRGAEVDSIDKLANANVEDLYDKLKNAIEKKVVRVPETYELTLAKVRRWTLLAKRRT